MLDRCLTWIYALSMKACVHGWERDPAVSGAHKLTPVTCSDTIKSLEKLVKALAYMVRRDSSIEYLKTDSAVISAAKKLVDSGTLCREFFLVPSIKYTNEGRAIHLDITVSCAEEIGHEGPCVSAEGYVRWSYKDQAA